MKARIIEYLRQRPGSSAREVASGCGIDRTVAVSQLWLLKDRGQVKAVYKDREVRYELVQG